MAILCGKNYTLNLAGLKLSDEQLQDVPRPRAELGTHITLKCVQAFSILGTGIGASVATAKGSGDASDRAFNYGHYGAMAGLLVGPVMSAAFMRGKSTDSIVDRSYRLRLNTNQVRADRLSIVGALVGAGLAQYSGAILEKGALFGFAGGCLFAGVINTVF